MKKLILFLCTLALLTGCTAGSGDEAAARQALTDFFNHLNKSEYDQAAALYGGDYVSLREWNPEMDTQNLAGLWENGCRFNGLQCLEIRSATLKEQYLDVLIFNVEFENPDGTLFTQGPCCGADESEQPPVSQFEYRVQKTLDDKFVVLDTPPYLP